MHSYLTPRAYLSPSLPYARAHRNRMEAGGGILRRWLRVPIRQWQRNKMIAALHAMDDRILRDIGIYRGEIRSIVEGFDDRELGMRPLASPSDRTRGNDGLI